MAIKARRTQRIRGVSGAIGWRNDSHRQLGVQSLGYNVGEKKYSGVWIDSFMNYRWELGGAVDEASKELTLTTRGPGPTGDTMAFRERYQFDSADSITIIGEMQRGEQWVSFSTTHLTRKK